MTHLTARRSARPNPNDVAPCAARSRPEIDVEVALRSHVRLNGLRDHPLLGVDNCLRVQHSAAERRSRRRRSRRAWREAPDEQRDRRAGHVHRAARAAGPGRHAVDLLHGRPVRGHPRRPGPARPVRGVARGARPRARVADRPGGLRRRPDEPAARPGLRRHRDRDPLDRTGARCWRSTANCCSSSSTRPSPWSRPARRRPTWTSTRRS